MSDQSKVSKKEQSLIDFTHRTPIKNYALNRNRKDKKKLAMCLEIDLTCTMDEAVRRIKEAGFTNRKGKPLTFQAIRNFSEQFIVLFPDEARSVYQDVTGEYPYTPEGEAAWLYTLVSVAVRYFNSKANFIRWSVQYRIYKKAFRLFFKHFNLSEDEYHAFDDVLMDYD